MRRTPPSLRDTSPFSGGITANTFEAVRFRLFFRILTKAFKSIIFDLEIDYKGGRDMKKIVLAVCIILAVTAAVFAFIPTLPRNDAEATTEFTQSDAEFPIITKAVLYRNGVPEEIEITDYRLNAAVDYIMTSVKEGSYGWIQGVLHIYDIETNYMPQSGMYMLLETKSGTGKPFDRYDKAIISESSVVFIDSDSKSQLSADTPFNKCITPYFNNYTSSESIPDILRKFF